MTDHAKRLRMLAGIYEEWAQRAEYPDTLAGYQVDAAALLAGAEALEREEQVRAYAIRLARAIHAKHYRNPGWQVLPDVLGILTQIDNMVAGLMRPLPAPPKETE